MAVPVPGCGPAKYLLDSSSQLALDLQTEALDVSDEEFPVLTLQGDRPEMLAWAAPHVFLRSWTLPCPALLTCTDAPSSSRRMPSNSSTASSTGHKPQTVRGGARG